MTNGDRIGTALSLLRDLWPNHDGPGHIVYADCNLRDQDLRWCVGEIDRGETYSIALTDISHPVFAATRALLEYLLAVPEADRLEFADSGAFYELWQWSAMNWGS